MLMFGSYISRISVVIFHSYHSPTKISAQRLEGGSSNCAAAGLLPTKLGPGVSGRNGRFKIIDGNIMEISWVYVYLYGGFQLVMGVLPN